jgi:hypothetical protein
MNVYSVSTLAYRQTPEHRAALELPQHARRPGRYHDRGDPSPLYASSTPEAAMSEFLRQVARGDLTFAPDDVRRLSTAQQIRIGTWGCWQLIRRVRAKVSERLCSRRYSARPTGPGPHVV